MVIVEKSFPRGGTNVKDSTDENAKENIIFGAVQKKLRKSKSKPKDDINDLFEGDKDDAIETFSAELLNYDTIQDGMSIMGMVKAVDQLYLSISLPGRMTARVSALEISDAYTKATKDFLQQAEGIADNYKPLKDLYYIGEIVCGRVQEVKKHENGHTEINMTLKPAEVHSELLHTNIKKGFIFSGAVEEVQEHGYIIESGIKGLRTFVPIEKSKARHVNGELIHLKIEKITQDKAASTCICKEVKLEQMKIKNQNEPNLDYILPTAIVQFNVHKHLKDGLQGTLMNEAFTAYVNEHQLSEPLALPEDYELHATLSARVLYVMPLTKLVYLTLNLHNDAAPSQAAEAEDDTNTTVAPIFKRGDIIESAKVHRLGTGGVILVLKNKFKGVISYKAMKANYKGNYDQDELLTKYATKSKHKIRILDYDYMDSMYICTDDGNIVNEKVFALSDLQAGEFVMATVKGYDAKIEGFLLQVGKVKGIIEKLYLAPKSKTLEQNTKLRCRVVAVNMNRKVVYLTNRAEYLAKSCKVLTSLQAANKNAIYTGTIVKCYGSYFLIKFFNDVKGVLHKQRLNGLMSSELDTFAEGQTMQFRILSKNDEQITLTLADDTFKLGEICPVTVMHCLESGLEIEIAYHAEEQQDEVVDEDDNEAVAIKGLIPIRLLSNFTDLLHAKLRMFPPDTETLAVCMIKNIFSLRDVEYFQSTLTNEWRSVVTGDIMKACVKNVTENVVELMVPIRNYGKLVKLHLNMLLVHAFEKPNIMLEAEQVVYVKVLSKEETTKTITVSAKLIDVWDGDLSSTAQYVESYLNEVAAIKKAYKKQSKPLAKYSIGDKVTAHFQGVNAETNDWQYEIAKHKVTGIVKATIFGKSKTPKIGEKQECIILWVDYSNEVIFLSNKSADMTHITNATEIPTNLVDKLGINAKVILRLENIFICSLKKGQNPLVYCPTRLHYNDFENSASNNIKEGDFCKLAFIHQAKPIAVLESTWKLWHDIKRKRKAQSQLEAAAKPKKAKIEKSQTDEANEIKIPAQKKQESDNESKKEQRKNKQKLTTKPVEIIKKSKAEKAKKQKEIKTPTLEPNVLFFEDTNADKTEVAQIAETKRKHEKLLKTQSTTVKALPGVNDFWSTDLTQLNQSNNVVLSSDEDDDADVTNNASATKKRKLTTVEKFKEQREEEARLRSIEEKYADPNQLPESVDQFDRLVLSDPNNSKHWINYMVYHLQSTEIDKARAVARRAIKAISFRDGNEQLNIWVALLNLELRYGSKETFDECLKEALTNNDALKIYLRTLEILCDAKKTQEVIAMIGVITKKFKAQQEVWKAAASAYFSIEMPDRAQQMLHKAVACLPEREHVNTIVIFANLNHKYGNNEMAQTLMDQVVTSYPKRVDVWTQYVDMLIKENLIESARAVLERAVIQKIPLKKMRTIFKKYLEFEERFGTETDIQKVKHLATEYVKNNATL